MPIEMTPSCGKCGSNDLIGPDDMTDESIITCESCGAECGTVGELKAIAFRLAEQKVAEDAKSSFGKTFEGANGVTFAESDD